MFRALKNFRSTTPRLQSLTKCWRGPSAKRREISHSQKRTASTRSRAASAQCQSLKISLNGGRTAGRNHLNRLMRSLRSLPSLVTDGSGFGGHSWCASFAKVMRTPLPFRCWWSVAAALVEGALTFVVKHAQALNQPVFPFE